MVDLGLLYSIAESSAAFVAIVAAFFTTKILTIASESRTVRNHIKLLEAEVEKRQQFADAIQNDIEATERRWAKQTVKDFYNELYRKFKRGSVPTLDEIYRKFEKIQKKGPR